MAAQNSNQTRGEFGNIIFREIHKNAWLKKVNVSNLKKVNKKHLDHKPLTIFSRNARNCG
jgi:Fe-S cluster biosynthesis and repair protein YggX